MLLSKKNILFYFFLFFWVSFSFSQKSTHNINVKIYQEDYESKIDVEKRAKEQLKKEALNKAGVLEDISIITSQFKIEDNDGFSDVFNSDMFSSMNGGVTNIKNEKGELHKNGKKAFFSFLYKPGAINFQICIAINGNAKNKAKKNAILSSVKKASCNAV